MGYFLDTVRVRTLAWAGRSLDRQLAPAALRASLEQASANPGRVDTDALRDIAQLRAFLSGPGVLAVFDAPWLPAYLLLISLMHPMLGLTAAIGAIVLITLGVITHRLTREHTEGATSLSRASARLAEKFARNAEVVIGMGMTRAVVDRWSKQQERLMRAQEEQVLTSSRLSALARSLRQVLQVTMLAVGAWLVIDMQASAGIMIAATILLSRALQPAEYLISGWRTLTEARTAWRKLNERPMNATAEARAWPLPAPAGRIDIEKLAYAFSAGKAACYPQPQRRHRTGRKPRGDRTERVGQNDAHSAPARPVAPAVRGPCVSMEPTSRAGIGTLSVSTSVTCRRMSSCSPARWARTSLAWAIYQGAEVLGADRSRRDARARS